MELWKPQEKLILPASVIAYDPADDMQETMLRPEPLLPPRFYKTEAVPMQPLARLRYYWRKDPAYKVFMIAACMVLIAGTVFVTLASAAVIKQPDLFGLSAASTTPQKPTAPTPSGTVDFQPAFPTPGGGKGTTLSSQPPVVKTPALPTTPTPSNGDATPTPTTTELRWAVDSADHQHSTAGIHWTNGAGSCQHQSSRSNGTPAGHI